MAEFTISCAAFVRLATITKGYSPGQGREELLSVTILRRNGRVLAAATNSQIFVVEFLGTQTAPDEIIRIVTDEALVEQCRSETAFGSSLTVQTNDILKFATAKTTFGYNHPTNAALWDCHPGNLIEYLIDKASTFKQPKKSSGAMHWYIEPLQALFAAAPSGRVMFPEKIDATEPVILRDPVDPNWCGMFLPTLKAGDKDAEPATLPDWLIE